MQDTNTENTNNDYSELTLSTRVVAMPADTNPDGDMFGGWVLSAMDLAGSLIAKKIAKGRVVTIGVNSMTFLLPVFVGDTLCCYVKLLKTGNTSITIHIEAWASRQYESKRVKVTEGVFTYVSIYSNRKPRSITDEYK
ncbi:MAG: acyl-CoA thioesterase [Bdellovibrionaceae bacterium]|nr:acyl-CoA thioesterase [Pseudobdellovibrionaceae bacterium]